MSYRTHDYLNALRAQLRTTSTLHATEVAGVIAEHRDLLEELAATGSDLTAELGTPTDYAQVTAAEFRAPEDPHPSQKQPQGTLFGIPYDFRGPGSREVRSRIWDPQDPRILQPRLFGLGWTINLGAVAVKLGWIRPDDLDADVIAAIPTSTMNTARAVPAILAGATALSLARNWQKLPEEVAMNYRVGGQPQGRRYPKPTILLMPLLSLGLAALPFLPNISRDREDTLRISSTASLINAAALGTTTSAAAEARGAQRPGLCATAALGVGVAAPLGVLVVPFRAGLRKVWQREGLK